MEARIERAEASERRLRAVRSSERSRRVRQVGEAFAGLRKVLARIVAQDGGGELGDPSLVLAKLAAHG